MMRQTGYFFVLVLSLPMLAFGWGGGHDVVGRAVAARLPEPWRARLQGEHLTQFCVDNHYPDANRRFEEDPRLTLEERRYLAARKMTVSYHFHSDEGRGVAFTLLVRALRENRYESTLLWLGTLSHSTADMVACNHDPITHLATYGWCDKGWNLRLPNGLSLTTVQSCLDLGWIETDSEAKAIWERRAAKVVAADSGRGGEDTVLDVMLAGLYGVGTCAPYGVPIVRDAVSWSVIKDLESLTTLAENLSVLGCWAVERILNDFQAAERLAKAGTIPEVTDTVRKRYHAAFVEFVSSRCFEEDSLAKGLMTPLKKESPYVVVVSEPTWRMNEGMLGFNDRVLAAQTVTTLRKQGMNVALMDVRKFMAEDVPVVRVPMVIVFAQKVSAYYSLQPKALTEQLVKYRRSGGKIIWIGGGVPDPALCDFPERAAYRVEVDKGFYYSYTRLPVNTNAYATLSLKVGDHALRKLERTPNFNAGWHIPNNTTLFRTEFTESLCPLAYVYDGAKPLLVGCAWPKVSPEIAYLPSYVVYPYLWTREVPALVPFELGLDSQGLDALDTALAALRVKGFEGLPRSERPE